jgi:rod shape determining protein RodA
VAEKFGFVGVLLVMAALVVMVLRILWIARRARRDDGMLLCIGVAAVMVAQILENVGMCLALLPVIGITLPFMSYGGSSILAIYMMAGVLHSIHAHHEKPLSYYSSKKS